MKFNQNFLYQILNLIWMKETFLFQETITVQFLWTRKHNAGCAIFILKLNQLV